MNFLDIKTESDLESFLDISHSFLIFAKYAKPMKRFDIFTIPKKNGGIRIIKAPKPQIKSIHYKLKEEFDKLCYRDVYSHGFIKGKSIVTNANLHKGKKIIVNIDLCDFFESIHIGRIIGLLTKKPFNFNRTIAVSLAQIICCGNKMCQGSPCSPVLSNMVFYSVDKKINRYINGKNIVYSRYADDLTFSFNNPAHLNIFFDKDSSFCDKFEDIFISSGFRINKKKTRTQFYYMHQEVTGLKVNNTNYLNLNRDKIYRIRGLIHALKKYGCDNVAIEYCRKNNIPYHDAIKLHIKSVLRGSIAYLGMVRGLDSTEYIKFANDYNAIYGSNEILISTSILDFTKYNSVFFVENSDIHYGTAFLYKGLLITCAHCLYEGCKVGDEMFYSNHVLNKNTKKVAKVIGIDEIYDIAVLKCQSNESKISFTSAKSEPKTGDSVKAFGYPDYDVESDYNLGELEGKIVSLRRYKGMQLFSTDMPMQFGISGGPILNEYNELIGIASLGNKDFELSKIHNGFVPVKKIDELIEKIKKR